MHLADAFIQNSLQKGTKQFIKEPHTEFNAEAA